MLGRRIGRRRKQKTQVLCNLNIGHFFEILSDIEYPFLDFFFFYSTTMVNGERLFSLLGKMKRFLRNFFRALFRRVFCWFYLGE